MKPDFLEGQTILVTGGTGSFGQCFVRTILESSRARKVIVFSRDELKQSRMQVAFAEHDDRLRYFLGDVRDASRLERAFEGVDIVVHAAALKQVPLLEYNPSEAVLTNIIGTQNVINAAIDRDVKKVLLVSTDKAANPANLYGATKMCAERITIRANFYSAGRTKFGAVRYGNVLGSRGSLIQIIEEQRKTGVVSLTHEDMTRFWITLDQGVKLVCNALERMQGGEIFIPKLPSMRVKDLIAVLAPECEFKIVGIRPGEKMHELLITPEEVRHTREFDDCYAVYAQHMFGSQDRVDIGGAPVSRDFVYASDKNAVWLDEPGLHKLLESLV